MEKASSWVEDISSALYIWLEPQPNTAALGLRSWKALVQMRIMEAPDTPDEQFAGNKHKSLPISQISTNIQQLLTII
jgi:hypothetical protein